MNLRVIAEGIESSKHLEHLREMGCEFGQGYYFSQPAAAEEAEQLLFDRENRVAGAKAT